MGSEETETTANAGPLAGIRVLDLTQVVMGPLATQILADQGADVILVEPGDGDINRELGAGRHPQLAGTTLNLLRNKRSALVDLKTPEGRDRFERIVASCDALVTTLRTEALRRLGVDYESVRQIRPDIVYCQALGFPSDSDRAGDPAYDDIIQAACGVSDLMERVWGQPSLVPTVLADKVCGIVVAQAVTAALFHRLRSGEGQYVEVPMVQAMTAFILVEHGDGAIMEPPVSTAGYKRILSRERRPHPTKDGYVHLFPYLPKHYALLFAEVGMPGADRDPRYATRRAALLNSDSLYRDIRRIALTRTTDEWIDYCRAAGIPATRVATLDDLLVDLELSEHPVVGTYRLIPQMANFGRTPGRLRHLAPLPGEQTEEILAELRDREAGDDGAAPR